MKCPTCGMADLMHDSRDLPYTYKGESTVISDVTGDYCPACGEAVLDAAESARTSAAMLEFNKQVNASIVDPAFLRYAAKDLIGDPVKDAAQFKATSSLAQAARIKAPVLMAYGTDDRRVPLLHGEEMRDVLRKQGTPVEWVAYVGEGHGFLLEANRIDFYTRVAKFLDAHLGAKTP
jgi:YgiT-type zinc finger domain-containing protein